MCCLRILVFLWDSNSSWMFGHHCYPSVSVLLQCATPSLWSSAGLVPVCAGCPCAGEPKTRQRSPDVVSQVLGRKEYSFPLACWLLWFQEPACSWPSRHRRVAGSSSACPPGPPRPFTPSCFPAGGSPARPGAWGHPPLRVQAFAFGCADLRPLPSQFCRGSPVPSSRSLMKPLNSISPSIDSWAGLWSQFWDLNTSPPLVLTGILVTVDYKIKLSSTGKGGERNNYLAAGMLP